MANRALRVQLRVADHPRPAGRGVRSSARGGGTQPRRCPPDDRGSPRRPRRRGGTRAGACGTCRGRATAARCEAPRCSAARATARPGRRTTRPGGRTRRCDAAAGPSAATLDQLGDRVRLKRELRRRDAGHAAGGLGDRRDEPVPLVVSAEELALLGTVADEQEQVPVARLHVDDLDLHLVTAAVKPMVKSSPCASARTSMRGAPRHGRSSERSRAPISANRRSRTSFMRSPL